MLVAGAGCWRWLLVLVAGAGCWCWLLVQVAGATETEANTGRDCRGCSCEEKKNVMKR